MRRSSLIRNSLLLLVLWASFPHQLPAEQQQQIKWLTGCNTDGLYRCEGECGNNQCQYCCQTCP